MPDSGYVELGEYGHATTFLESAIRHGSPYEAYYYLAEMHSNQAHDERSQAASSVKAGSCSLAVSFYKLIAERGSWEDDLVGEAETMWAEGTLGGISGAATISLAGSLSPEQKMRKEGAKLRWMIAAESGSEVAQNNLAYLMDQGKTSSGLLSFTTHIYLLRDKAGRKVKIFQAAIQRNCSERANSVDSFCGTA